MSAIISHDGLYRYQLERCVADTLSLTGAGVIAFFGINPSTADATIDDQTVKKLIGFSRMHGFERFVLGNVFAYRSKDVRELARAVDPIGRYNDQHISEIIARADMLVPCWGRRSKVPAGLRPRLDNVLHALHSSGKPVKHFGLTKCGSPCHPQMLPYSTPMVDWIR